MKRYEIGDIYAVKLRKPEKKTAKCWKLHRLVVNTASQLPEKGWITKVIISPSSLRIHYENQTSASDSFPPLIIPLCYYRRFIDVVI